MMEIKNNFDLTDYNSYKIRSKCKRAFFPVTAQDFIQIYNTNPEIKKVFLGGGYNIILSKEYYEEDFIMIGDTFSEIEKIDETLLKISAGVDLKELSLYALEHELSGMEVFYDIPSSMGGAVVMNAGASGEDINGILLKVEYLDLKDMVIKEIKNEDISFEYRNSFFQKNTDKIVLNTWLNLTKGDKTEIKNKMDSIKKSRWGKQPKGLPNAGSVFKRPKGYYVGTMIEELGLKGTRIGGAQISEKHAGFIVNVDNAKGKDILKLIAYIKKKVFDAFEVNLEVEQRVI